MEEGYIIMELQENMHGVQLLYRGAHIMREFLKISYQRQQTQRI